MIKNKIYIDVKLTKTMRIEISEEEGYDVPDTIAEFAEFYCDIKNDAYDIAKEQDWDEAETEDYEVMKVWIKK